MTSRSVTNAFCNFTLSKFSILSVNAFKGLSHETEKAASGMLDQSHFTEVCATEIWMATL